MNLLSDDIKNSLFCLDGPKHKFEELEKYYFQLQDSEGFEVNLVGIKSIKNWRLDDNFNFVHDSKKFFSIKRVKYKGIESGILDQAEIGILGILSTKINGIFHILVQFKEEPGNINKAQLSPTIQATKSNYSKTHGGNFPPYWEEFVKISKEKYLVDSLQPEQGFRYWKKFNQNLVADTEYLDEKEGFKWMTLGQVLAFAKYDNSINSCLRSVLSLILYNNEKNDIDLDDELKELISKNKKDLVNYGSLTNNIQNFYSEENDSFDFFSSEDEFSISGVQVNIKNREVTNWFQPIIIERKKVSYVLVRVIEGDSISYLWSIRKEPGYENGFIFGPSEIIKSNNLDASALDVELRNKYSKYGNINEIHVINMAEEGGRFWRESVPHLIVDIYNFEKTLKLKNSILVNEQESRKLIFSGLLGIEARSIFVLSKTLDI